MKSNQTFILFAFYIFLCSLLPVLNYLGLSSFIFLAITIVFIVLDICVNNSKTPFWFFIILFLSFILSFITSLYWGGSIKIAIYPINMVLGLYIALNLKEKTIDIITVVFSYLSYILLIGSYIGALYAISGGEPILAIKNPDGRSNWLYLTTFTNARVGKMIRPSGIFDEPGALSFFLCITCIMRYQLKKNSKGTWFILLGGFITLSLAHFIIFALFLFTLDYKRKRTLLSLLMAVFLLILFFALTEIGNTIFSLMWSRLPWAKTSDVINKNSRVGQMDLGFYYVFENSSLTRWFFSIDPCFMDSSKFPPTFYGPIGETPFSPLLHYGLLIGWPYYVLMVLLVISFFLNKQNIVLFALALLIAQRPYVMNIGYSLLIFLPFINYINRVKPLFIKETYTCLAS